MLWCVLSSTLSSFVSYRNIPGERRIRVITLALPTTQNISELYASADQVAIATLLANKAVERALTHKLEDSREFVFQRLVELLVAYKTNMTSGGAGASAQLAIGENMKMLPVLVLGLLKNVSSVFHVVCVVIDEFVVRLEYDRARRFLRISGHIRRRC